MYVCSDLHMAAGVGVCFEILCARKNCLLINVKCWHKMWQAHIKQKLKLSTTQIKQVNCQRTNYLNFTRISVVIFWWREMLSLSGFNLNENENSKVLELIVDILLLVTFCVPGSGSIPLIYYTKLETCTKFHQYILLFTHRRTDGQIVTRTSTCLIILTFIYICMYSSTSISICFR